MLIDGGLAPRTTNVAVAALRLLYDSVLGQPEKVAALRFRRVPHRLPRTMPEEDVEHLIQAMTDMRYRMASLVDYGSALRVCEVVSRQIQDIRRGVPEQAKRPVRSAPPRAISPPGQDRETPSVRANGFSRERPASPSAMSGWASTRSRP